MHSSTSYAKVIDKDTLRVSKVYARQTFRTNVVTHFITKRKLATPDASSSCQAKLNTTRPPMLP